MPLQMDVFQLKNVISRGAEARIIEANYLGKPVYVKHRYEKKYRSKVIDQKLRQERTIQEIRLLQLAKLAKVNVPEVLDVDKTEWSITLERLDAVPIKVIMFERGHHLFLEIGRQVGILHSSNIIHGDLTTSNILVDALDEIYFIDFGLGFVSNQIESKAVDLLVLKHILESSHPNESRASLERFNKGYHSSYHQSIQVLKRMIKVESRVRYKN